MEVKDIRDKSAALEVYFRQAKRPAWPWRLMVPLGNHLSKHAQRLVTA